MILLCTFATEEYAGSAELLRSTALAVGKVDGVVVYTPDSVPLSPEFLPHARGAGLWSWNPTVISKALAETGPGDVVIYSDAGSAIVGDLRPLAASVARSASGIGVFRLGEWSDGRHTLDKWTRPSVLDRLLGSSSVHQIGANFTVWHNRATTPTFLAEYKALCTLENLRDEDGFQHRHNQSVLSALVKRVPHMRDVTQFGVNDPKLSVDDSDAPLVHAHRMAITAFPRISVITPTTGNKAQLSRCIASVQAQTQPGVEHVIVVDGAEREADAREVVATFVNKMPITVIVLPHASGKNKWNGHRIYAGVPFLLPGSEYVAFLDEDNWYHPAHLATLCDLMKFKGLAWAHSLRTVHSDSGDMQCYDLCESLGVLGDFADPSSLIMTRDVAMRISEFWNKPARPVGKTEADRDVYSALARFGGGGTTGLHTSRYMTGNRTDSVTAEFFAQNNRKVSVVYVFHFGRRQTSDALFHEGTPFQEWQQTLLAPLKERVFLANGYLAPDVIPPGATVLVNMCDPASLPEDVLSRRDLLRIGYTAEGPNIRHTAQWDPEFLKARFDKVLTYWEPCLRALGPVGVKCPFIYRIVDNDISHARPVAFNKKRLCVMVLERRDLTGVYRVKNVDQTLACLDRSRENLVRGLRDVVVVGESWKGLDGVNVYKGSSNRFIDNTTVLRYMEGFTFGLVVDNCDAEGYVSEKVFDCLVAGIIPVYLGSDASVVLPKDVYVNVRDFETTEALQAHLDALDVDAYAHAIRSKREAILSSVSPNVYANLVCKIIFG